MQPTESGFYALTPQVDARVRLRNVNTKQLHEESQRFGLVQLLNGLLGLSVPNEIKQMTMSEQELHQTIRDNLKYCCAVLRKALPTEPLARSLATAVYTFTMDTEKHQFALPSSPEQPFDTAAHDRALENFKLSLLAQLRRLQDNKSTAIPPTQRSIVYSYFLAYARSLFELRQFQAPPRSNPADALMDAFSRDHYWEEYLQLWGVMKYIE